MNWKYWFLFAVLILWIGIAYIWLSNPESVTIMTIPAEELKAVIMP